MMVLSSTASSLRISSLSFPLRGIKPSITHRLIDMPLTTKAANTDDAPGITDTLKPLSITVLTNSSPGSEMPGVPASLTKATMDPSLIITTIFDLFLNSVCSSTLINFLFSIPMRFKS